ncbi:uncharacterized protein LOC127003912 [Eriocheir sinensis]|uniref:uncharacterized protein LOC127003912 n=1 Tax=Eriocheir sinensis TaxID=95602 RepID=UPI0021CA250C|nr:uncharacterized protein LOC127003912 [Eriocheir sinensis]
MLAAWRLAAAVALCAGVSAGSLVYVLGPGGVVDHETDVSARLGGTLPPAAPPLLHEFTLCLWFHVITFHTTNPIMSYTLASDPFVTYLGLTTERIYAAYQRRRWSKRRAFRPLRWYTACLVVRPTMLQLWIDGEQALLEATTLPLPLDGRLVLGRGPVQEVNEGLDFSGHVTLLSVWDYAFTARELDDWGRCRPLNTTPLIGWDDLAFTIHNGTAGVIISTAGPCDNDSERHDEVLLFTFMMEWKAAVKFMKSSRLWTDSHTFSFHEQHKKLMTKYSQACKSKLTKRVTAWTGLLYNCSSGEIENLNGFRANATPIWISNYTEDRLEEVCRSRSPPLPIAVSDHGHWSFPVPEEKVCVFAELPDYDVTFNFRMNCDGSRGLVFSYMHFILAPTALSQHSGGGVYLHGVHPYVIEDTYNNGTWCLKRRASPTPIFVACTFSFQIPLGHRSWTSVGGLETELADPCMAIHQEIHASYATPLLLSTCTREEFTCNNTQCIALDKVCDRKPDCQEGEDEQDCVIVSPSYGRFIKSTPAFPLPMTIIVLVKKISNIDLMNFAMTITLHVKLSWTDPRLEFRHLLPGQRRLFPVDELWMPKLWVLDSLEGGTAAQDNVMVQRSGAPTIVDGAYLAYKGSENPLWKVHDMHVKIFCSYDLRKYPSDRQTCNVVQ